MTLRILTLAAGLLLAAAAPAGAATVSRSGATVTYTAGAGEANRLTVTYTASSGDLSFAEFARPDEGGLPAYDLTAGPGCTAYSPTDAKRATCPGNVINTLIIKLGDQGDVVQENTYPQRFDLPSAIHLQLFGGSGDDDLVGSRHTDLIDGGPGADDILGQGGLDALTGGGGADGISGFGTLKGGAGNDRLNLIQVGLKPLKSKAYGGAGADSFVSGNKRHDLLDGGSGKDIVFWGKYKGEDKLVHIEKHVP